MACFGMQDINAVKNPMVSRTRLSNNTKEQGVEETMFKQLIGSFMYLIATRSDLIYTLSLLSKFTTNLATTHWLAAKCVLRYIRGTICLGIWYKKGTSSLRLLAFSDSDYAKN